MISFIGHRGGSYLAKNKIGMFQPRKDSGGITAISFRKS
jgi:hypothetical protein